MMIRAPRKADFTAKQETNTVDDTEKSYSKPSSSSTPWSRLKDPRIVRVSRAFGGKDRHSKVYTLKGLRDRRVRLSVPTAIQLYDLQERLGLNQPSKVVDWLLNAAKHDIDELPPLQMPIRNFDQDNDYQSLLLTSRGVLDSANEDGIMMINSGSRESSYWNSDKSKEINANYSLSSHNSTYRWDPSILSLSHFRPQIDQDHHLHNFNVVQFPSVPLISQLPSGSQVLVCPTGVTTQPYFPSHLGTNSADFVPKQINHYQMFNSTSQNPIFSNFMRPFQLSMAPSLFPSQNHSGSQSNNADEFSPDEV